MLEATPSREMIQVGGAHPDKQRRRLSIAIVLLLSALIVVLVKDRNYWFGSEETTAADDEQVVSSPSTSPSTAAQVPSAPVVKATKHVATKHSVRPAVTRNVRSAATASQWGPAATAAERVQMASIKAPLPQPADYPLLAGQMSVQGSVLLQALIAADGVVEDLRVLSGPTILVSAAREAVRQWKFKPYLENGKPVETQARVTVNFTIKVSNNTARYQATSITSDGAL
jgi:TonB family protein